MIPDIYSFYYWMPNSITFWFLVEYTGVIIVLFYAVGGVLYFIKSLYRKADNINKDLWHKDISLYSLLHKNKKKK